MSKDIKEEILKTVLDQNGGYDFNEFVSDYTKTYSLLLQAMDEYASLRVNEEVNKLKGDGWIRVEDELPELTGYYITWCKSPSEYGLIHYHINTGWQNGFYNERVTHWIKPSPPKQ